MKFFIGFLVGLVCGVIATLCFGVFVTTIENKNLTLFPEPGACITKRTLKVFQVLDSNKALVEESDTWGSPVMLLMGKEQEHFYDDQIVKISAKQCARQVGTFQYQTKNKDYKTVPVVRIEAI